MIKHLKRFLLSVFIHVESLPSDAAEKKEDQEDADQDDEGNKADDEDESEVEAGSVLLLYLPTHRCEVLAILLLHTSLAHQNRVIVRHLALQPAIPQQVSSLDRFEAFCDVACKI